MLQISDKNRSFYLSYESHKRLESNLNRTHYSELWSHISDFLFDSSVWKKVDNVLYVTVEQYDILFRLSGSSRSSSIGHEQFLEMLEPM